VRAAAAPSLTRAALVTELTETVRDSARESNYRFVGPVEVALSVDPRFGVGDLAVDASIVASPEGLAGALVMPDGRRVQLGEDPVTIGRLPDCTIALSDSQVSRRHAMVHRAEKGFAVVDLGSLNGTTVNGVGVQEQTLTDGDVIGVGETAIRYEES